MTDWQQDDGRLEELLRSARERQPPGWLKEEIMARVEQTAASPVQRLARRLLQPMTFRFSPAATALVGLLLAVAFWGGMVTERRFLAGGLRQPVELAAISDDAEANFLLGRGLLAGNRPAAALTHLQHAAAREPGNADYAYWQGVAYWAVGNEELERQSYLQAVEDAADHLPSLVNLGHSYLAAGDPRQALVYYRRALYQEPELPEALYNSGLAYQQLEEQDREQQAFRRYLAVARTGRWALRAVDHLHQLGDFTYRSYRLGRQRLVVNATDLAGADPTGRQREIQLLADTLRQVRGQELHLVVYHQDNPARAKATALELRERLLGLLEPDKAMPIRVSWFAVAETIDSADGQERRLSPTVMIFTNPINKTDRRNST